MPDYFYDSSALVKRYHTEVGSPYVKRLFEEAESRHFISELTSVEVYSALNKKKRLQHITFENLQHALAQFSNDASHQEMAILRITPHHFRAAQSLIERYGAEREIRTLDALQLAVAIDVKQRISLDTFVCADVRLGALAEEEGLSFINPITA